VTVYFVCIAVAVVLVPLAAIWLVRALILWRGPDPPGWWAALVSVSVALALPAVALVAYQFLPAPVNGRTLMFSMNRATSTDGDSYDTGIRPRCSHSLGDTWVCRQGGASSGYSVSYRVTAGWRCWRGRRADQGELAGEYPLTLEGCTVLRDVVGPPID
jgi:hypothetical protein